MRFPFPSWNANTDIKVYRTVVDNKGEPTEDVIYEGKAIYDEKQRQVLDAERRLILLSGKVIIKGDIAPRQKISGYVAINGVDKAIHQVIRPRNPDGTIYSTELDLM